jgi:hypothetical protein
VAIDRIGVQAAAEGTDSLQQCGEHSAMRRQAVIGLFCGVLLTGFSPLAPTHAQTAKDSKTDSPATQDALTALKKLLTEHPELIDQLKTLLDQTQKDKGGKPVEKPGHVPDIPAIELPGEKPGKGAPQAAPTQPAQGGVTAGSVKSSLTPDISVIGNHIGRFISVHGDPDRNRFQLGEVEIGLQQPIYPGVRFDAFLNGGDDDAFKAGFEEAYVTATNIGGLPVGGLFGKKRLNFGKVNALHPHSRLYVDQPAVLANLLDPDSLNGNGASFNYLFPFKNLFANLEVGMWKVQPTDAGQDVGTAPNTTFYPAGHGITGNFPMARLWLSKELKGGSELEVGTSHGYGKADIGDNITLHGVDVTYRMYPSTFSRFLLQSEIFWHNRDDKLGGTGSHTRSGHYVLASYKPDQFWEYGFRYDNSRFAWPLNGREQTASFILTNRLTEVSLLRFQYKYGDRTNDVFLPAQRGFSELWLQFIWGAGSHTHALQ